MKCRTAVETALAFAKLHVEFLQCGRTEMTDVIHRNFYHLDATKRDQLAQRRFALRGKDLEVCKSRRVGKVDWFATRYGALQIACTYSLPFRERLCTQTQM